jgi:enoyl-CoA hydratase/carnithine racemase
LAPESVRALARIWRNFALDRSAQVAILSGEGPSFCAGMDLKLTDPGFGRLRLAGEQTGLDEPEDEYVAMPGERRRTNYVPPPDL